jgi:hypothetical protein
MILFLCREVGNAFFIISEEESWKEDFSTKNNFGHEGSKAQRKSFAFLQLYIQPILPKAK